ncbi:MULTISPECIES: exodeoxyribonuclease VII large subunit [Ramlibacter]|uniref:Exodeoxyribonuclease 7 large subunit n=1 Tax=Ramlibacter aquaticus TaxID=2780094 RepID=A0ABR9SAH4_9BURK|nr:MULTISPECIES: exodeoxyribonuclease VII large subunit [Ramlibacter]MBE7939333.1 exodeoxyribonuclease VII large subunit [Ramlibacter aquaticus]
MSSAVPAPSPRVWSVGALCRAVADTVDARFNPVAVRGELTGCSRPSSGHLYFSLKDASGQIRCAMFRRAAGQLDFVPRDGEAVEAWGRLGVYEARGDLQLVVERLTRAGQGALFEQFLRLKAKLEAEGLFHAGRKRELRDLPRGIGLVTSPGAAALHDVATALRRRAPHVPVLLAPAAVQGAQAPGELVRALESLYALSTSQPLDVILLVRGGGAIEDLWAFNDEQLARTLARSPVPVVSGVGHETDFTIADFVADVRAPTPTAAAELAARPREAWLDELDQSEGVLRDAVQARLDAAAMRLDQAASRLGRPLGRIAQQQLRLARASHSLRMALGTGLERERGLLAAGASGLQRAAQARLAHEERLLQAWAPRLQRAAGRSVERGQHQLDRAALRLELLDPRLVLQRGYAILTDPEGHAVTRAAGVQPGQALTASLADGDIALQVQARP